MAKKYLYEITINHGQKNGDPHVSKYGFIKNIEFYVQPQQAVISFTQGSKKPVEDLITFKMKLVRDALRKVYLIHVLSYDCGLAIKNIQITIDGETWTYDSSAPNFPFLFSMIPNRKQHLSSEWKDVIDNVIGVPKTTMDTDLRFCSLFSFLAAKSRRYRIDRFTNLWTAMNAYGNYLAKMYDDSLKEEYDLEAASNTAKKEADRDLFLYRKDVKLTQVLQADISTSIGLLTADESNELWEGYYGIQSELLNISINDYPELYAEAKKALDENYTIADKYKPLEEIAARFKKPLYIFLLLEYPYQLRCNYLHGSFSTILFSAYNDYEIASLGVVNYFLESFLNEKLPGLFTDNYWTPERYEEIKSCVRFVVDKGISGNSKFDKIIDKIPRKQSN